LFLDRVERDISQTRPWNFAASTRYVSTHRSKFGGHFSIDAHHQSFSLAQVSEKHCFGAATEECALGNWEVEEDGMDPMTNGRVSDLEQKHRTLNEQVDRLARRAYLTPTEQRTVAALKKEKLMTRDLITQMRRP
jgi:hypothetical protein